MILVDTSIWIDHLRAGDAVLVSLLGTGEVLTHPSIIGELALGQLAHREEIVELLRRQPRAVLASDDEMLHLIDQRRLTGTGIGYVDAQLVAATLLTPGARLWTRDKRLAHVAARLGITAAPLASN